MSLWFWVIIFQFQNLKGGIMMFNTLKTFLKDESGSQFIENGLWIGLVVLTLAGAGVALAKTISGKYTDINGAIGNVEVPSINK